MLLESDRCDFIHAITSEISVSAPLFPCCELLNSCEIIGAWLPFNRDCESSSCTRKVSANQFKAAFAYVKLNFTLSPPFPTKFLIISPCSALSLLFIAWAPTFPAKFSGLGALSLV